MWRLTALRNIAMRAHRLVNILALLLRVARGLLHSTAAVRVLVNLASLASIALFALWTLHHYQAPAPPAWVGMTIRAAVFAIWIFVLREWLLLRIDPDGRPPDQDCPPDTERVFSH
jgi:hypothetical protein